MGSSARLFASFMRDRKLVSPTAESPERTSRDSGAASGIDHCSYDNGALGFGAKSPLRVTMLVFSSPADVSRKRHRRFPAQPDNKRSAFRGRMNRIG
jgi:hypothetical protein